MAPSITNWKTTVAGVTPLLVGSLSLEAGLSALFHIPVPGITVTGDPISMIWTGLAGVSAGLGLFLAKDGDVTGGTRQA